MATTCYGESVGIFHIGTGGGFFGGGSGMCVNHPVDAASYSREGRLYIYGNIGYSSPNIRTIRPGYADKIHYFSSSANYCWIYWDWGDYYGDVTFELRSGTSVRATRSTYISSGYEGDEIICYQQIGEAWSGNEIILDCEGGEVLHSITVADPVFVDQVTEIDVRWWHTGNTEVGGLLRIPAPVLIVDGVGYNQPEAKVTKYLNPWKMPPIVYTHTFNEIGTHIIEVLPNPNGLEALVINVEEHVCDEGTYSNPTACDDMSIIYTDVCSNNAWVPSGQTCPIDPCEGVVCNPECYGYDKYNTVCIDGTCAQGSLMEANSPYCGYVPPDPCEGIVCEPECIGYDLYNTICSEGSCTRGNVIEANSQLCGYIPPEDPDDPIPDLPYYDELIEIIIDNKELVAAGVIAGIVIIR